LILFKERISIYRKIISNSFRHIVYSQMPKAIAFLVLFPLLRV
jgi:hypothetical protein